MTTPTNGPDVPGGGTPEPPAGPVFPAPAAPAQPAGPSAQPEPTQALPTDPTQPVEQVPPTQPPAPESAPPTTWATSAPGPAEPATAEPATAYAGSDQPPTTPPASPVLEGGNGGGGGRKKTALIAGGAVAAVAILGVGGAVAFQNVMGPSGAQPEAALPASTVAFAKVDLDPSGSQKVDAIRFLRKFPDARDQITGEDADLRKVAFEGIQDEGLLQDVDYATDIEPWLGERFGVGVIPGADGADPIVAVALAVTDQDKARDSVDKLSASAEVACEVGEDYAVCAEDADQLKTVTDQTEAGTLADADQFSSDMDDLGENGIVSTWADLGAARSLIESAVDASGAPVAVPQESLDQLTGRFVAAVRFDGANLELAGKAFDLPPESQGIGGTASVESLPEDTLAAMSVSGVGAQIDKNWDALAGQLGGTEQLDAIEAETGLVLPDDLVDLLGSRVTVAFGGMEGEGGMPEVALVTDGERETFTKLVDEVVPLLTGGSTESPVAIAEDGDNTVLALGQSYADEVADGSGLSDTDAFKDAVPNADGAQAVVFANLAALVEQFGTDLSEEEAANLAPLNSLCMSIKVDGADADYALRLTTK